jgi:hypothetical protein
MSSAKNTMSGTLSRNFTPDVPPVPALAPMDASPARPSGSDVSVA